MGEKDISSKSFEALPDVFADIMNTYLFYDNSEFKVDPELLRDLPTESFYHDAEDNVRNQFRDVFKGYENACLHIACFGLENTSTVDRIMPVRDMGYAYGNYRSQTDEYKRKRKEILDRLKLTTDESEKDVIGNELSKFGKFELIPVITLVLNFSGQRWSEPENLIGLVSDQNPLRKYMSDYKIHVIDVINSTDEEMKRMTSDLRHMVFLLAGKSEKIEKTDEMGGRIDHPVEFLDILNAYGKVKNYRKIRSELLAKEREGEETTMKGWFWEMMDEKEAEGRAEGRAEGEDKQLVAQICKKLRKGKSIAQIADEVEEDEIRVKVICDAIAHLAPEYDMEKAVETVRGLREAEKT